MATQYFVNGGSTNNWSDTLNWSATSGGSGGNGAPNAGDTVHFDTNSPNCVINTNTNAIGGLVMTGYAATWSGSNTLSYGASGSDVAITFPSSMTQNWTGTLNLTLTESETDLALTTNGNTLNNITINCNYTTAGVYFEDNLNLTGTLTLTKGELQFAPNTTAKINTANVSLQVSRRLGHTTCLTSLAALIK